MTIQSLAETWTLIVPISPLDSILKTLFFKIFTTNDKASAERLY